MTCKDVLAFLSDYRTGDLPAETREVFVRHLDVCPSCRAYLESYERTIALAKAAARDVPAAPRELEEAILLSLGKKTSGASRRTRVLSERSEFTREGEGHPGAEE